MRILVISQYFYPENFRINQLCLDLKARGHQVTVLTGKPNYPKGEYFENYSFKKNEDEQWEGIQILRVPLRARGRGSISLIRNYISFVYHANRRIKKIKHGEFDIIYVFEVSPITVALPAIKIKKRTKIPIIMNVQDLWPENIIAVTGINFRPAIILIDKLVNYIYKHCNLLLCASPSFVEKIERRTIDKKKIIYWPQYASVEKKEAHFNMFNNNHFNIVFTGNIGEAQGLELVIKAAKQLKNTSIRWHLIGEGRNRKELEKLVELEELQDYIKFYGFIKEEEIPNYLNNASAALLILKPNPVFEMTIPAKLQTYLSCGIPILGCVSGEAEHIIIESESGIVSKDVSTEGLVEVCRKFMKFNKNELINFRANAIKYSDTYFNKEILLNKLDNYMEEIV